MRPIVIASLAASMFVSVASAGPVIEWRNNSGTNGWEIFTITPGNWTRVASKENSDVLFLTDGTNIAGYSRGQGGATAPDYGLIDIQPSGGTVTDLSTDDAAGGDRFQIHVDGDAFEVLGGLVDSTIANGNHLRGEIAFLQDRYWTVQNGALHAFSRGWSEISIIPDNTGGTPAGNYLDVTAISQAENYSVFALTATGFDEFTWNDATSTLTFVDSYTGLFNDPTGISVDGSESLLYVSTLNGLYSLDRDNGWGDIVSPVDTTIGYLDVDVPRADVRPIGQSAIVWAVAVPEPSGGALLLIGLVPLLRRRRTGS